MPSLARSLWLLCVLGFMLEVGFRFMPFEWFSYRLWEALKVRTPPGAAFEPNRKLTTDNAIGDLGYRLPFPEYRRPRSEEFVIDECGFRNPPNLSQHSIDIVLLGDSFAVGAGTLEETSPRAQLAKRMDIEVYSLAEHVVTPQDIELLTARSNSKPRAAVLYFMERSIDMLSTVEGRQAPFCSHLRAGAPNTLETLWRRIAEPSRLKLFLQDLLRPLFNDVLFPSQLGGRLAEMELRHGSSRLYWRFDAAVVAGRDDEERLVELWQSFSEELRSQGIDFFVILLPSSYNAYESLAINPPVRRQQPSFLERLQQRSSAAGIPTLNLESTIRAEAQRRIANQESALYWKDDTHWSPEGIAFATQHIAAFLEAQGVGDSADGS